MGTMAALDATFLCLCLLTLLVIAITLTGIGIVLERIHQALTAYLALDICDCEKERKENE